MKGLRTMQVRMVLVLSAFLLGIKLQPGFLKHSFSTVFLDQKMTHIAFKMLLCFCLRMLTRECVCAPCLSTRLSFGCVMGGLESVRLRDSWESTQSCLFLSVRFLTVSRAASPPKPCNIPLLGNSGSIPSPTLLV